MICTLLLLPACQSKLPPPPPERFTAQARVTFGETHFTAALEQVCPGSLRLEFTAPPELEGMAMRLEGGTAIVSYGGMEAALPTPALPQAGFAGLLCEALRQLASPAPERVKRAAGGWDVTGTVGGLTYTVRVDMEGIPRRLHMPGAALTADLA